MVLSLPLLLVVPLFSATALGISAQKRDVDPSYTTDPSQYYRSAFHSSVLLGDTLYRDGGDFSSTSNIDSDGNMLGYPLNSTYSLDLSTSWSPSEAVWNVIDKGDCPILNRPNLWPAPDGKSYYSFNGDVSQSGYYYQDPPSTPQLWRFTPNGLKSGSWELVAPASAAVQYESQGSKVAFGNDSAHILGGFTNWRTTRAYGYDTSAIFPADGIISYDIEAATWQNRSIIDYVPSGWWLDGSLHFVENLGGIGLVIAIGGTTGQQGDSSLVGQTFNSYDRIGLFNPITGEWRNQTATGDIPTSSRRACSVAVPGDNGTVEIFLHGGSVLPADNPFDTVQSADVALDQVWVLSLPSFTWYKSSYEPSDPRFLHTCHVPGNPTPRRQMVAVGGYIPELRYVLMSQDPWPQGLGIFDLTEMEWKDSYDANAAAYETPKIVKDGIAKNGIYPKKWDDPIIAQWLVGKSLASPSGTAPSSAPTSTQPQASSSSSVRKSNTGAIAGGVVGGVLGLALLAGLAWFFLRRQRVQKQHAQRESNEKAELEGAGARNKPWLSGQTYSNDSKELGGGAKHEMLGSTGQHEMPAPAGNTYVEHGHKKAGQTFEMQ